MTAIQSGGYQGDDPNGLWREGSPVKKHEAQRHGGALMKRHG